MRKFWRKRSVAETDNYKPETEEENVDTCSENVERGKYILIADSGATKCSWAAIGPDGEVKLFDTPGVNLAVNSPEAISLAVHSVFVQFPLQYPLEWHLVSLGADEKGKLGFVIECVTEIWIYSAGATSDETTELVKYAFGAMFPNAEVNVLSDILGAARAVCGSESGIVGILGTGSNSCFYDGKTIVKQGFGGGYVLGDEGSGAWFGKRLLSDFIRDLLPEEMAEALQREHSLDYQTIVENVYRAEAPSRYLASFFPFLLKWAKPVTEGAPQEHSGRAELDLSISHEGDIEQKKPSGHEYAAALLREGIGEFLDRCIAGRYDSHVHSLNLCGSVAWFCRDMIAECASARGMILGKIVKSPIDGLVAYHSLRKFSK